jgi:hypothetical protein
MITYVYETLPRAGQKVRRFELSQSIKEAPLTRHPETGEKIRRCLVLGPDPFVRAATLERRQPQSVKRPKRQETHDHHGHDHDHHHH